MPAPGARLRVLWVIKALGPGGAEQLLLNAARVHDHEQFDIECAFLIEDDPSFVADVEAAGVVCHRLGGGSALSWPLRLRQLIARGGYRVVHVHSPLPGSVARLSTLTLRRRARPTIVTTEHCIWSSYHPATRTLNRWTSRLDAAVLAVSDETLESITGPAARRAETLVHGIPLSAVSAEASHRDEVRRELGAGDDEWVIGTVANFREQKDYPNLLAALRILVDAGHPVRCVSVGHGPLEAEIRARAEREGLGAHVTFLGKRRDATRIMSAFDVFTLASSWEGLPVAMMEALAIGLPIVATRVGGIDQALGDESLVTLVPPGDAAALAEGWRTVLTDPMRRSRMAARSLELASEYDIARAVERIESLYQSAAVGQDEGAT